MKDNDRLNNVKIAQNRHNKMKDIRKKMLIGSYHVIGEDLNLNDVEPRDVILDGEKVGKTIDYLNSDVRNLKYDVAYLKNHVLHMLEENGYDVEGIEKEYIIEVVGQIQVINPNKEYIVVDLINGYVAKGNKYVVESDVNILELYKGYCIIDNHQVIIDEDKKLEYIRTLEGGV